MNALYYCIYEKYRHKKRTSEEVLISLIVARRNVQTESAGVFSHFDQTLRKEALRMSDSYKLFYGLEVSIRNLIKTTMEGRYGEGWWKWIDVRVKENVKNHLAYELDMPHTKRSQNNIDYTTFGDLRKIINSNWSVFESKFNRNLNSVNEVMINLNRLRVSIAHCTPLVEKEVKRLEIYVDDWFEILKDA